MSISAQNEKILARFEQNIESGKFFEVERDLFNYVVANPKDALGFALLAKIRLKQNRFNEAKSLANRALSLNSSLIAAKLTLADAHFQANELEQTRAVLESISDAEITDNSLRLNLSQIYANVGDCGRAMFLIEKLPLKLKNSEALPLRASCYLANDDRKNLAAAIATAKTLTKQNPGLVVRFAEVLSKANKHKETADLLGLTVVSELQNIKALLLLAKSEIYLKDIAKAKIHLAQAEKIQPESTELFFVKAIFETEQGKPKEAVILLEKALVSNPNNTEYLSNLVISGIRANENRKAFQAAEKLVNLEPNNADFLYLYGAASLQNNNLPKAEMALIKFLEMRPNDGRGCLALGLTFAAQPDKLDVARQQMQKCLAINPNNYEAAYQLGLSYKTNGETAKAIEYFETTVKLSPDYAIALRDLGAGYLQTGAEAKARPILEKAVLLNPNDADTHFQLSRLYNVIGERELAKKHLDIFQKLRNPKKEGM